MNSLSKFEILGNIFNISNVPDFQRTDLICKEPEDMELLGFEGGKMIFKNTIMDNSPNTTGSSFEAQDSQNPSNVEKNIDEVQSSQDQPSITTEDSPKTNETLSNMNSTEEPDKSLLKIVQGTDGRRFLLLNGQKLQIIKNTTGMSPKVTVPSTTSTGFTRKLPPIFPKVVGNDGRPLKIQPKKPFLYMESRQQNISMPIKVNRSESRQHNTNMPIKMNKPEGRQQNINMTIKVNRPESKQQNINTSVKVNRPAAPKFKAKVLSLDKSKCPVNISNIMKEVGGTIRLVNMKSPGNPLTKDSSSNTSVHTNSVTFTTSIQGPNLITMDNSQCICKNKPNVTSVSTSTDRVKVADKEVQTDKVFQNQIHGENQSASPLSELYNSEVIIGDDVNMGHGPPGLFIANERKMKIKFFQDLKSCLKWDSGKLPIHKAVIEDDLQMVKGQCVILKIRKAGVNIPDGNNYTPLQLSIMNNGNIEIVKILLEYQADMSVLDEEGNNILHLAVEHNRNDLIKIFLDQLDCSGMNIDHFNYEGVTPLMLCALLGDRIDMAEQLLKYNADLNLKDRKSGRSAIFHAAVSHNAPMVSLLLDYGADTKIRNFFGTSVHDAMFELDDIPNEIKYPILGRDLKINEKRKLNSQDKKQNAMEQERMQEAFKRRKLEIVSTIQKFESKAKFVDFVKK